MRLIPPTYSHTFSNPTWPGQHPMGRGLTHLKTPVQQVPGMSVELSRSLPICEQAAWVWNVGWGGCGCVLGCEALGSHGQVGHLDASLLPPQYPSDLPVGGSGGFFMEPLGRTQEIPGFQFRGGSSGFQGAFSLPAHHQSSSAVVCSILFLF